MKELTIEQKVKRYDEAIRKAKITLDCCDSASITTKNTVYGIFPELKESEDERIRKGIIDFLWKEKIFLQEAHSSVENNPKYRFVMDAIAWLEKQGNHLENYDEAEKEKAGFVGDGFIECQADFLDFKEGNTYWLEYIGDDKYNVRSDNLLGKTYHITPGQLYTVFKKLTWLEKQGEQILTNSAKTCKNEPKFENGQWIVWKDKFYKVNNNGCGYELIDQNGLKTSLEYSTVDENAHIFTTQDAKDGDVLVSKDNQPFIYNGKYNTVWVGAYCGMNCVGDSFNLAQEKCYWTGRKGVKPASKKQRIHLFQKIKEAGYEWNAEKKELKLLISNGGDFESNNSKQKPTWSDEDEENLQNCCGAIGAADYYTYDDKQEMEKWLKSLKERLS